MQSGNEVEKFGIRLVSPENHQNFARDLLNATRPVQEREDEDSNPGIMLPGLGANGFTIDSSDVLL